MSGSVIQSGPITIGHAAVFSGNGTVQDAGTAEQGVLSEVGITNSTGDIALEINNGAITGPYSGLGFAMGADGVATLSVQSFNGAPPSSFVIEIDGVRYSFPGSGTTAALLAVVTISALRALTTTFLNNQCYVLGYYAGADGGEGPFWFNAADTTSADNGGTIIVDAAGRRWYRETGGLPYSVKWFGAKGDAFTDDTAAFQATLTAIAALGGGKMYMPTAFYKLLTPMTYSAGVLYIEGGGKDTTLLWNNPTAVMFTFAGTDITLSDFRIMTPYLSCTAGGLLNFTNPNNVTISHIWTDGGFEVIQFIGAPSVPFYRTEITDCNFVNVMNNAVFYSQYHGGESIISNTEMLGAGTVNSGNGIIAFAGDTFHFSNINIAAFKIGIEIVSQVGGINYAANVFATNVFCDGNGHGIASGYLDGWVIDGRAATTAVARIYLVNCWAGSMGRNGFNILGASDVRLTNCIAIDNGGHGFVATSASASVSFRGCTATGNSLVTANVASGFIIDNGVNDFQVIGCKSGSTPFTANIDAQQYGIAVVGPTNDHYVITDNSVYGNATGAINDSGTGTHKVVANNLVT